MLRGLSAKLGRRVEQGADLRCGVQVRSRGLADARPAPLAAGGIAGDQVALLGLLKDRREQ